MAEIIACSGCRKTLQVPEQYLGQTVQCPECGHTFIASATTVSSTPMPVASAAGAAGGRTRKRVDLPEPEDDDDLHRDHDDDDILDVRRRGRYSRLPPNRGGLICALGVVSLVGGWLFCLPIVVGPIAWYLAQSDLRAIRDGEMDGAG